jgi:hypothetical protein
MALLSDPEAQAYGCLYSRYLALKHRQIPKKLLQELPYEIIKNITSEKTAYQKYLLSKKTERISHR